MATITITNKNATATSLLVDGVARAIGGSGTLSVDEGAMMRLLNDNVQRLRFLPAGDLTRSAFAPGPGPATSFAVTVDATALGTVPLVPAVAGFRWETRRTAFSVAASTGSPTAAEVAVRSAGAIVQGVSADGTFAPLTSFAGLSTAAGVGLDVTVDAAATGGTLSIQVTVDGRYV
jgi:hypothetical protein